MTTPDFDEADCGLRVVEIEADQAGERIDKVLAERLSELSRGRVQALIALGLILFVITFIVLACARLMLAHMDRRGGK